MPVLRPACLFSREGCERRVTCHVSNVEAATGHAFTAPAPKSPVVECSAFREGYANYL